MSPINICQVCTVDHSDGDVLRVSSNRAASPKALRERKALRTASKLDEFQLGQAQRINEAIADGPENQTPNSTNDVSTARGLVFETTEINSPMLATVVGKIDGLIELNRAVHIGSGHCGHGQAPE